MFDFPLGIPILGRLERIRYITVTILQWIDGSVLDRGFEELSEWLFTRRSPEKRCEWKEDELQAPV